MIKVWVLTPPRGFGFCGCLLAISNMLSLLFLDLLTLDFSYRLLQALKQAGVLPLPAAALLLTRSCQDPGLGICNLASEISSRSLAWASVGSVWSTWSLGHKRLSAQLYRCPSQVPSRGWQRSPTIQRRGKVCLRGAGEVACCQPGRVLIVTIGLHIISGISAHLAFQITGPRSPEDR